MKNKWLIVSLAFMISLLPMLLPQYGGCRGVQEISGLTNLLNPIGVLSVVLFFSGILFKKRILGFMGCVGIVIAEIYEFLTWHIMTISGEFSIDMSFRFAYPEFYIGFAISALMVALYVCLFFFKKPTGTEKN